VQSDLFIVVPGTASWQQLPGGNSQLVGTSPTVSQYVLYVIH
jgi:hypothetical protein